MNTTNTQNNVRISFEFFPDKDTSTPQTSQASWNAIKALEPLQPEYISVTYGAGGSTQNNTRHLIEKVLQETSLTPAAHLTCVGASKEDINAIITDYWKIGVKHIVALRGDTPKGQIHYTPHPNGYANATDLVKGIKDIADFEISVSAYPEKHPESTSLEQDVVYLKEKIDAGASQAITQFFFDNNVYYDFLEKTQAHNITAPIIPGILPIANFSSALGFAKKCGTSIPVWLQEAAQKAIDNPSDAQNIACDIAMKQCNDLIEHGVTELHIYTLNNAELTEKICHTINR